MLRPWGITLVPAGPGDRDPSTPGSHQPSRVRSSRPHQFQGSLPSDHPRPSTRDPRLRRPSRG
eukprot:749006-Hanusia_phi.AAC.1